MAKARSTARLSRSERMERTCRLYDLLQQMYEIKAVEAHDDDDYERFRVASRFYREAYLHLRQELERLKREVAGLDPQPLPEG